MSKSAVNLQDAFLNQVRKENQEVQVALVDGSTLKGSVKGFDNFTLVINSGDGTQHLVYKHAIAQIVSARIHATPSSNGSPRSGGEAHREPAPTATVEDKPTKSESADAKSKKSGFNPINLGPIKVGE